MPVVSTYSETVDLAVDVSEQKGILKNLYSITSKAMDISIKQDISVFYDCPDVTGLYAQAIIQVRQREI